MTRKTTTIARFAGVMLALFAGSAVASGFAETAERTGHTTAVVLAGDAANDPSVIAEAKRSTTDVRVVHAMSDELGVTHMLAAQGYDVVVTVGVDRRIAITPVEQKFPHTRFVAAEANGLGSAIGGVGGA